LLEAPMQVLDIPSHVVRVLSDLRRHCRWAGQSHLILHGTLLFDTKSTCGITV
jgi:hypothetical protein